MAIPAVAFTEHTVGMDRASTPALAPASGRGGLTRVSKARRAAPQRISAVSRARAARNQLRPRTERFAHLKRMYD